MLEISFYLPKDKAYICINRLHFFGSYTEDKKVAMKQFVNHILFPHNIKYLAAYIRIDCRECGISETELSEIGFYIDSTNCNIYQLLNKNFEKYVESSFIDAEVKEAVLQDYRSLKFKEKDYLNQIRKRMNLAKEELYELTGTMLEAKKIEIKHYENMLESNEDRDR